MGSLNSALWYLTRATGVVVLLLLSVSVVLGVLTVRRAAPPRLPAFVTGRLHRDLSLLALALLCVHILTAVLDGYAPIRLADALIPFRSAYRPLWLGFGALAFDMLLAVALTSMLRRHLGRGAWAAVHWLAYACWPVALLHALGSGSDVRSAWMLAVAAACTGAVLLALFARAAESWPRHQLASTATLAAALGLCAAVAVWLPGGPLARGWARRAGTPHALLGAIRR
jgi:sulfoxide reductase heme-binding subunit YedZ